METSKIKNLLKDCVKSFRDQKKPVALNNKFYIGDYIIVKNANVYDIYYSNKLLYKGIQLLDTSICIVDFMEKRNENALQNILSYDRRYAGFLEEVELYKNKAKKGKATSITEAKFDYAKEKATLYKKTIRKIRQTNCNL